MQIFIGTGFDSYDNFITTTYSEHKSSDRTNVRLYVTETGRGGLYSFMKSDMMPELYNSSRGMTLFKYEEEMERGMIPTLLRASECNHHIISLNHNQFMEFANMLSGEMANLFSRVRVYITIDKIAMISLYENMKLITPLIDSITIISREDIAEYFNSEAYFNPRNNKNNLLGLTTINVID